MRSRSHQQMHFLYLFFILASEEPKGSTVRFWLCCQKVSFFSVGLPSCYVTLNTRDSHKKKKNQRDPYPFANSHTLACPFGMHCILGLGLVHSLKPSRYGTLQKPMDKLRTPGRKRTDHMFLGLRSQVSMSSSERWLCLSHRIDLRSKQLHAYECSLQDLPQGYLQLCTYNCLLFWLFHSLH